MFALLFFLLGQPFYAGFTTGISYVEHEEEQEVLPVLGAVLYGRLPGAEHQLFIFSYEHLWKKGTVSRKIDRVNLQTAWCTEFGKDVFVYIDFGVGLEAENFEVSYTFPGGGSETLRTSDTSPRALIGAGILGTGKLGYFIETEGGIRLAGSGTFSEIDIKAGLLFH